MKYKISTILTAVAVTALLVSSSSAQMGRRSSGSSSRPSISRPSSSTPRQTYQAPRQSSPSVSQSSGMGRRGSFNEPKNTQTTPGGMGMGRSGSGFNQTPQPSTNRSSSSSSSLNSNSNRSGGTATLPSTNRSTSPRVGGTTSSTTRVWKVGDRPTTRYERTEVVGGRTRYVYSDGSYSFDPTGLIVGYMILDSMNDSNAYQRGVNDATRYGGVSSSSSGSGAGFGTVFLAVLLGIGAIIVVLYFVSRAGR